MSALADVRRCLRCSGEAAVDHAPDATDVQRAMGLTVAWRHTDTGSSRCPDGRYVEPEPRCAQCASPRVVQTAEAWGDVTTCPDCGFRRFVSIGD